jgi:hypothetical protein
MPSKEMFGQALSMTAATMAGIEPKDGLEVMLASLMIATYDGAIRCFHLAARKEIPKLMREHLNLGGKLARSFTLLLDTLNRHRGKGQKITVEHVHVHTGGQAIVGSVSQPGGGGIMTKTEDNPMRLKTREPSRLRQAPRC